MPPEILAIFLILSLLSSLFGVVIVTKFTGTHSKFKAVLLSIAVSNLIYNMLHLTSKLLGHGLIRFIMDWLLSQFFRDFSSMLSVSLECI